MIIRAGRLWDGSGPDYRHDVDVIIEGNRIATIAPATKGAPSDSNAQFIDATRQTLIPGLVDMHTHRQMQGYSYGDRQGRLWLAMGVTSTRSPGAPAYHMVEDREAIDAGLRVGPRHFATGEAIDGSRIFYNFMRPVVDERQLELELARAEALSYDMIKTYVRLSPKRQEKVIEWAHARGMHVSSHYHFPAFRFAGDCMEHLGATNRLRLFAHGERVGCRISGCYGSVRPESGRADAYSVHFDRVARRRHLPDRRSPHQDAVSRLGVRAHRRAGEDRWPQVTGNPCSPNSSAM